LEVVEVNSIRVSVSGVLGLAVTMCAAVALAGAPVPAPSGVGVYSQSGNFWMAYAWDGGTPLPSDFMVNYGGGSLVALVGDWDGDGNHGIGLYSSNSGTFWLQDDTTSSPQSPDPSISNFRILNPSSLGNLRPLVGDWDGDDADEVGLYDQSTGTFYLSDSFTTEAPAQTFDYGAPNSRAVAGNWNNSGGDGIGIYTAEGNFWLKNVPSAGAHDIEVAFGDGLLRPVVGEWVAGTVSVGLYNSGSGAWFVRNDLTSGPADASFGYGDGGIGLDPVVGWWETIAP
jgi:hypothetical protein